MLNATIADHSDKVNIAIMCPPDIYGRGRGRGLAKTWSAFVPFFVKESMGLGGKVFYYGEGMNTRSWVHIDDLMIVYLKVVEAAAAGGGGFGWGKEVSVSSRLLVFPVSVNRLPAQGYYFAGTQEVSHIEVAKASGKILKKHGVIKDEEPVQVSTEQLDAMMKLPRFPKLARYMFASNSRTRPHRAEKLFGYKGTAPTLLESLEEDIMQAVKSL